LDLHKPRFAKKAGMNTNGYAKIERGESGSKPVTLKKIAKALEIDFAKLLDAIED